jgi:hypothetical protein
MDRTLSKGTKSPRLRSIGICVEELLVRRAVVRGEWHATPSGVKNGGLRRRNAAKLWRLVLNLFPHYLLFTRKSDVYDVRVSGR